MVDDASLVSALIDGEFSALGDVFDLHARHLVTYADGFLRDSGLAADVTRDALVIASQRVDRLRDPADFRPWLYAIVRFECLRVSETDRPRPNSFEPVPAESGEDRELQTQLATAATVLSPSEREALELAVRHDLDNAQVGSVLGITTKQARTLTSRAVARLERSLAIVLLAQERSNECADLAEMLASVNPTGTSPSVERIGKHMNKCAECGAVTDLEVGASALLRIFPLTSLPFWLRDLIVADAHVDAAVVAMATRIDPLDSSGFPRIGVKPAPQGVWVGAAGAAILVGVGVGLLMVEPAADQAPMPAQFEGTPVTTILPRPVAPAVVEPAPAAPETLAPERVVPEPRRYEEPASTAEFTEPLLPTPSVAIPIPPEAVPVPTTEPTVTSAPPVTTVPTTTPAATSPTPPASSSPATVSPEIPREVR